MKRFRYEARDKQGKKVAGIVEAFNERRAVQALHQKGLYVCALKSKEKRVDLDEALAKFGSVSEQEVATFTRVLGTMVRTGLPLTDALGSLMTESGNLKFKRAIEDINKKVQGGSSLVEAMRVYPKIFDELYLSLVEAGETAGNLDKVLERLATMKEASVSLRAKVKSALIYPAIILLVMTGVGALMMVMVIPKIAEVYSEMDAPLPLPTQILISLSDLVRNFWWLLILILPALFFGLSYLRKNRQFDYLFNNLMLKIPIFGALRRESILALFTRTLGTLLKSGVAILQSLKITAKTLGNNAYQRVILKASERVEKGTSLSMPLQTSGLFPVIVTQMVGSGEETGTVDESLMRLADYFDEEVDRKVRNLTSVLEPVLIVIMGAAVAGLAAAVLMPMFNLVNVIK